MTKHLLLAASALLATLPAAASAQTYNFTFTGFGGAPSGSGTLTASPIVNAIGGRDITGIAGTFGGNAITGLVPNPVQPNPATLPTNTYDNVLFPNSSLVFDRYGIAFNAGTNIVNFFDSAADGGSPPAGNPYGLITNGLSTFGQFTFQAAAVPEPASWALMIAGFGMAGVAMRRRAKVRTNVSFA